LKDLQAPRQFVKLRCISAELREQWLVEDGWHEHAAGEDTFSGCAEYLAGVAPLMIGHEHLQMYWHYV
jgi:hypothetical protein